MMKHHSVLGILLAAGMFTACNTTAPGSKKDSPGKDSIIRDTLTKPQAAIPEQKKFTENALGCYYVQNNQYAGTPDSASLFSWLQPFVQTLNENGIDRNNTLFGVSGGPNGAQWNPAADLLVAAYINGKPEPGKIVFHVNGYDMLSFQHGIQASGDGKHFVCWFVIPQKAWGVQRHLPSKRELAEIYALRGLNEQTWTKNACTVIHISLSATTDLGQVDLNDYLLMAFGE